MNLAEKIYSIAPEENYLRKLAQLVIEKTGNDITNLSNTKIFLPNRRSIAILKEEFVNCSQNSAAVLPKIFAIGDIEEEELEKISGYNRFELKTISKIQRKALLTKLVLDNKHSFIQEDNVFTLEHASNLANSLLDFFDDVERNELDFKEFEKIYPNEKSIYWQNNLNFLKIAGEQYVKIIAEHGLTDPICKRNILIREYAEQLVRTGSKDFIFIAGSTGSQNATRHFIKSVLQLENGYFILPFKDGFLTKANKQLLLKNENELNQQHLVTRLLDFLECDIEDIKNLGTQADSSYAGLISEIFKPASEVINWPEFKVDTNALERLSLIEADNLIAEAKVICLIIKKAIEEDKSCLVITGNKQLAEHIRNLMKYYDLKINYTGGRPLKDTTEAKFFKIIGRLVFNRYKSSDFLAFLKNPLFTMFEDKKAFKDAVEVMETEIIRKKKIRFCDGLLAEIRECKKLTEQQIKHFEEIYQTLDNFKYARNEGNIKDILQSHIKTANKLSSNLFLSDVGGKLYDFLHECLNVSELQELDDIEDYNELLDNFLSDITHRDKFGFAEKIMIATPIEARLQNFDVNILTDLNEGKWPMIEESVWLSEDMRRKFGLPSNDYSVGLDAHDFVSLLFAKQVYLTRSIKASGEDISVPSPLLQRIITFYKLHGIENNLRSNIDFKLLTKYFDGEFDEQTPIKAPTPTPPKESRPKRLSVTKVEKLFKNPYSIYASEILKLRPLDEIEDDEEAPIFGTILHKILEEFANYHQLDENKITEDKFLEIGRANFEALKNSDNYNFWFGKFESLVTWFVKTELENAGNILKILTEESDSLKLKVKDEVFEINFKADRLEVTKSGGLNVIDFKTGAAPTGPDLTGLYKPQLLLEALVLKNNDAYKERNFNLIYYSLNQKKITEPVDENKIEALIDRTEKELVNLISEMQDEGKAFLAHPYENSGNDKLKDRYDDYEHLSRVKEWK